MSGNVGGQAPDPVTIDEVVFHNLELSKLIPEHIERHGFSWLKRDFSTFTEQWRRVRAKCEEPLDLCDWCKRKFADGDRIALAQPKAARERNWVLCQSCADEMEGGPRE